MTAVKWLLKELKGYINPLIKDEYRLAIPKNEMANIIEQAKQMEKEQLFKFFKAGQDSMEEGGKDFEQFYNGGNK